MLDHLIDLTYTRAVATPSRPVTAGSVLFDHVDPLPLHCCEPNRPGFRAHSVSWVRSMDHPGFRASVASHNVKGEEDDSPFAAWFRRANCLGQVRLRQDLTQCGGMREAGILTVVVGVVGGLIGGLALPVTAQESLLLEIAGVEFTVEVAGGSIKVSDSFTVALLADDDDVTADTVELAQAAVLVSRPSDSRFDLTFDSTGSESAAVVVVDEVGTWVVSVDSQIVSEVSVLGLNGDGSGDIAMVLWVAGVFAALFGAAWWARRGRADRDAAEELQPGMLNSSAQDSWWSGG